jgi:hypothetical protein
MFRPDPRSRRHQRYHSRRCAKKAKRERDRLHKKAYRATGLGREQRKRENERTRDRLGWTEFMRFWRKADAVRAARLDRNAAQRYYERHRDQIVEKLRLKRAAQRRLRKARSQ